VPYQAFEAADGWVLIGVTNDGAWRRFCEAADFEEMGANPDYATARGRIEHRDEIVAEIQAFVGTRAADELIKVLEPARIPVSRINSVHDVVESEQVAAIGAMVPLAGSTDTSARVVGRPVTFASPYEEAIKPAPRLGQDTSEILRELGLTPERIQELDTLGAF
jgi:crotonobetainyl-CoA:carnitine CoA-transferase CaiB-like acyl-CoA transferase